MYRMLLTKTRVIFLLTFLCVGISSCQRERIIYRNLYYEYDDSLMKYGIDSSVMFKSDNKLSKIDHDSLQTVIDNVYKATMDLIEDKTLTSDIDDLYLQIKKDSVWLVHASFRTSPDEVMIGGSVSYQVSNNGKISSIIIWE